MGDLVKLVGEVVSVERVPITFDVQGGKGTLKVGTAGYAELLPYQGASSATTTLTDTIFSTVPGAPVFVGKAPRYISKNEKFGIDLDLQGHLFKEQGMTDLTDSDADDPPEALQAASARVRRRVPLDMVAISPDHMRRAGGRATHRQSRMAFATGPAA